MGRIYNSLKRILEKSRAEGNQDIYRPMLMHFVTLLTYEDLYLMNNLSPIVVLKESGNDMFIDCGGFGVIIDNEDKISIHS
jgi:hypothetical protein